MPLDPTIFLNTTFFIYGVALVVGVFLYHRFGITGKSFGGKVSTEAVDWVDLGGLGLIVVLFVALQILQQIPSNPDKVVQMTPGVLISGMIAQTVPALIVWVLLIGRRIDPVPYFGLKWSRARTLMVIAPVGVIVTYVLIIGLEAAGYSSALVALFGEEMKVQDAVKIYQDADAIVIRVLLAISAVVIAPIVEEVVFRGYVYKVTKRYTSVILSTVLSAVFFSVVHNYIPGFVPLAFLAVLLTISYEYTGSLWAPISIHALFNACTLLVQEAQFHTN